MHSENCPSGQATKDGNEILVRLQESLDHFLNVGLQIIQNYPLAVGRALDQLNGALNDIRVIGFDFFNKV